MKILMVIPNLGLGGAETMCETLVNELCTAGNQVKLISLYSNSTPITCRLIQRNVNIEFLDKKRGLDLKCIKRLKRIIKEFNPEVIHSHLYAIKYVILATLFKHKNSKFIHTVHNVAQKETTRINRIFNSFFFKRYITPVALSNLIQASIVEEYGLDAKKVPIIFNGVDLSKCIKKERYASDGVFKFINVARFSPQKNHARLIEAFSELHDLYSNTKLILIGDGQLKEVCEVLTKKNNLLDCVIFCGEKEDVFDDLHKADVFVLSSDFEGMPMSVIEAMGTGLPIVSTDVGGLSDMITPGIEGYLCDCTSHSLFNAMREIIIKNQCVYMGKNAMKKAIDFSSKKMAYKYLQVYKYDQN